MNGGESKSLNLTFSGCGFLGIYHVGVVWAFKDRAPAFLAKVNNVGGASAGALAAGSLLCGISLSDSLRFTLRLAEFARRFATGPFHPNFQLTKTLRRAFKRIIPADAYKICSGRLHVSLTRCSDLQNVIISEFHSNDDLIDAIAASAHVPFYSGIIPPIFRGEYHMDGGITDNLPQHFHGETITVTPWSGESDICPLDDSNSFNHFMFTNTSIRFSQQNFSRMFRAFFPPDVHDLGKMCKQGYNDAIRYLKLHYPEFLRKRKCSVQNMTNFCDCNSTEVDGENSHDVIANEKLPVITKVAKKEYVSQDVVERCGDCKLDHFLEQAKVEILLAEKELSCFITRLFYNAVVKPCVMTILKVSDFAESIILSLPKLSTGVTFLDILLHTINDAIVLYKSDQSTSSCSQSFYRESQVYRASISEFKIQRSEDLDSEDYETARSESSFVTCVSLSISTESEDDFETLRSTSCDTLYDGIFCCEQVGLQMQESKFPSPSIVSSKRRWNKDAENIFKIYAKTCTSN